MCYSDPLTEWADDQPAPQTSTLLRDRVLAALAEAVVTRRLGAACCADCEPGARCADCREDLAVAREYEAAFMRVRRIGSDGAVLELTGGLS